MRTTNNIASVYNLYVDELFTYGLYLGFEKEIVMDATHDIFCKFASDETFLRDVSNIKFYLFKSLKNRLYDIHKQNKHHLGLENMDATMLELPFNINVNVEEIIIEKEEQSQIKREIEHMLNTLTPRQREIIYLRYVHEYDYDQIAELMQISVHGCRKLVSKAIITLREKFGILISLLILT
ncbi:MAG: RNA polymerase sigma factor [Proteiniphilum sp.]|nr:RNA polymerase sigma factor [Proteiniphilum sp.]